MGGGGGGGGGGGMPDAGDDGGPDASVDAGTDAGLDGGVDGGDGGSAYDAGPELYGVPWAMDSLSNAEIGYSHYDSPLPRRVVSVRFRAQHTGAFASWKQYFIFATYLQRSYCPQPDGGSFSAAHANGCYGANDGGVIQLELQGDEPATHEPDGITLSTAVLTDPMNTTPGSPIYGASGSGNFRVVSSFNASPVLQAGALYHLVYSNIVQTSDPWWNYDYVSLDSIFTPSLTQREPGASDVDLAVLYRDDPDAGWITRQEAPIYELDYVDGFAQGLSYIDDFPSTAKPISGPAQARETFTVSGPDRKLGSVSAYVAQTAAAPTGALTFSLLDANGAGVDSCSLAAAAGSTTSSWLSCAFSSQPSVLSGHTYQLVLSAPASAGTWLVYPLEKGKSYGFARRPASATATPATAPTTEAPGRRRARPGPPRPRSTSRSTSPSYREVARHKSDSVKPATRFGSDPPGVDSRGESDPPHPRLPG